MINLLLISSLFYCDIKGEVKKPGVYGFEKARIIDIVSLAGGPTKNSDISKINLSKEVIDEMVIYIPNKKEKSSGPVCNCALINPKCDEPVVPIITTTTKPLITTTIAATTTLITTTTTKLASKININTAAINELITLKGIGNTTANNIIEYRQLNPFQKTEDILNVKGIGESVFAQIKDFITV